MKDKTMRKGALQHAGANCMAQRQHAGANYMTRPRRAALAIGVAILLMANALTGSTAVAAASGNVGRARTAASGNVSRAVDTASGTQFSDVKIGQWFEPFVSQLAGEGIISGYPDGSFRPQEQVTTGQFLAMIVQTGEISVPGAVKSHWARPFYDAALEAELLFRDELPKTSLDQPISRLWMAVISSRMMQMDDGVRQNSTAETFAAVESKAATAPVDIEPRQPYSYEILKAYETGLLAGYPDGTFRPEGYLTRAEAATVIYKLNAMGGNTGNLGDSDNIRQNSTREPKVPTDPTEPKVPTDPTESKVPTHPIEPEPPAFGYDPAPADMTEGTRMFWMTLETDPANLRTLMAEHLRVLDPSGSMADNMCISFLGFVGRAKAQQVGEKQSLRKQGLRKEYVNGYPVLMEAVDGEVRVYVKPKGSETRFWGVMPGQVSEEFF